MIERVVAASSLADNYIDRRVLVVGPSVSSLGLSESIYPLLCRLHNTSLTRRANEGYRLASKVCIALIVLGTRVLHLLSSKVCQLIRTQSVLVVAEESIFASKVGNILVNFGDGLVVL